MARHGGPNRAGLFSIVPSGLIITFFAVPGPLFGTYQCLLRGASWKRGELLPGNGLSEAFRAILKFSVDLRARRRA